MSSYTGKRFVNPLNKNIGRRTGRDFRAGKNIRVGVDGFENFDDYFSESDAEVTREYPRRHASTIREESESAGPQDSCSDDEYKENQPSIRVSQSLPNATLSNTTCNSITASQSLSQAGQNRSKFGWLRNRDIGRRTGKNITANKQIRVDERGFENFDDYFSESDVSSLSSRLSVSIVKPVPRRSVVSNLVIEDARPSISSQDSQENTTADEEESQGEDADSQTEFRKDRQTRTNSSESDTGHEITYPENKEETAKRENKNPSTHKLTKGSDPERCDRTEKSRLLEDSAEEDENEDFSGENTTIQMSQSHSHKTKYIDTPLSSKRSKSHISGESDECSESKARLSGDNSQEIHRDKGNVSKLSESHAAGQNKGGKHMVRTEVDETQNDKRKTFDTSEDSQSYSEHVDTESDEHEVESEHSSHCNVESEHFDNNDRDDQDSYVEQDSDNNHDENDDEHTESDKNGESEDDESGADVIEVQNTSNRKSKSLTKNTVSSSHRDVTVTESSAEKEASLIGKAGSSYVIEVLETEKDDESVSDNDSRDDEEDDDLRPSQAQTNIDVAGNRSGSITKLDIPTSVVSFNRTRKRLSYSAGEASEESLQRNKSRIDQANAELFKAENSPKLKEEKGHFHSILSKNNSKNTDSISNKKNIKNSQTVAEESSEFLCLASRSTLPQQTQDIDDNADEEDDIIVLDYERPKAIAENGKTKPTKAKKQTKNSETDSHSESEKQTKKKNPKQESKSEIKRRKPKGNTKNRRKTTHASNEVNGLSVDLNSQKQNNTLVLVSENLGVNAENFIENLNGDISAFTSNVDGNINDNGDVIDEILDNESKKKGNKSRKKKGQKQTNESGRVKANGHTKNKNSKNQATVDIADITETNGSDLKTTEETPSLVNEDEINTEENQQDETESPARKQKTKQNSKRKNKRKDSPLLNIDSSVKEGKVSQKRKLSKKVGKTSNLNDSSDNELNGHESNNEVMELPTGKNKVRKKLVKKPKRKPLLNYKLSENKSDNEHVHGDGQNGDETMSNKSFKRKSSSDECLEETSETELKTKKARKSKGNIISKGKRKNAKQKSGSSSSSDNNEGFQTKSVELKPHLDESGKRTPTVDSRLSVPAHFGSGVSFRVSRRSELLDDVGSGYIGEGCMEPTGGLTPCISRPGGARKSKGRRVTICPEENIEHNISGDKSSDENGKKSRFFRWSTGTSVNDTPLPDPNSTPVHICETTNTATPHPGKAEESVIEDRLIKPSPPEQGLRRSQRTRLKPIAWYKNEQVVFDYRRRSGPAIIGVKPSLEVKWNKLEADRRKKRMLRNQIRNASRKGKEEKPYRKLSIHKPLPDDVQIEDNQDPEITVFNQNLQAEDGIECVGKRDAFRPVGPTYETPKKEDPYVVTKLLDHPCMSAGKLHIKPNAEKPEQLVTGDYTLFFMEYGKVLVTLHKTSFLMETGDSFMVPIGNTYSISNLRADTAKLFYTVHKQVDSTNESTNRSETELK